MSSWYSLNEKELLLSIFVKVNARKTRIVKADHKHLHISLHAKPKEGEANAELIRFLSEYFHLPKTEIFLRRGQKSRYKQVVCLLEKKPTNDRIIVKLLRAN